MPIITSMLDTDYYKLTMMNVVFQKFPDMEVEYTFKNRTKGIKLDFDTYKPKLVKEAGHLIGLGFTKSDLSYLKSLGLFSKGYLEYLKNFKFNTDVTLIRGDNDELEIKIQGTWLNTILWEVPLLAIVSELYTRECGKSNLTFATGS